VPVAGAGNWLTGPRKTELHVGSSQGDPSNTQGRLTPPAYCKALVAAVRRLTAQAGVGCWAGLSAALRKTVAPEPGRSSQAGHGS
jgi:hypothetical protein